MRRQSQFRMENEKNNNRGHLPTDRGNDAVSKKQTRCASRVMNSSALSGNRLTLFDYQCVNHRCCVRYFFSTLFGFAILSTAAGITSTPTCFTLHGYIIYYGTK
jgi:hypothetical protein